MTSKREAKRAVDTDQFVSLDDLFGGPILQPDTDPKPNKTKALIGLGLGAVVMGLFVGAMPAPAITVATLNTNAALAYWDSLPSELPAQPLPQVSTIRAANGKKIAEFYSQNRVLTPLDDVSGNVKDAVIAVEDSRFYEHNGIDPKGITRALVSNLFNDSTQGGSTLTQQYVKQVLADAATTEEEREEVTSRTSYMRKLREAKYAVSVERNMTKDEILEGYLNIAYFGDGAYGIGAAARHYFSKKPANLTIPESALLAGLVKNPTGLNPTTNPEQAKIRRDVVLSRMRDVGHITPTEYARHASTPVTLTLSTIKNGCTESAYPFFCQLVRRELETNPALGKTPEDRAARLYRGGMDITTTLQPRNQDAAQRAVDKALGRNNRVAANAVTVEPGTGHIVAMATNRTFGKPKKGEFSKTEIVLPATPAFQPGSAFKPITLAAALERGFNPKATLYAPDVHRPATMNYPGNGFTNSTGGASGHLTAAQATWRSSNTFFTVLEEQTGVLNVARMGQRLGLDSLPMEGSSAITSRDGSLTLGSYEVSPIELAGAYATFAARGTHCTPVTIKAITDTRGNKIAPTDPNCHEAIPTSVADTVANIMTGTINGPDPGRTGKDMNFGRAAAGKTGTTQGNAAVWFAGFTPQYATTVAVMDPRGGFKYPLRGFYANGTYIAKAYGGLVAGPIWREVMASAHKGLAKEKFPTPGAINGFTHMVPDLRGMTLGQAYQLLDDAGYKITLSEKTGKKDGLLAVDRVHSTVPAAGSLAGLGSEVTIKMTHGSDLSIELPE